MKRIRQRELGGKKSMTSNLFAIAGFSALLTLLFLAAGCSSSGSSASGNTTSGSDAGSKSTSVSLEDTGGRSQIKETTFDFGSVPINQKVEHNYEIRNVGKGPLKIGQLSTKRLEGC